MDDDLINAYNDSTDRHHDWCDRRFNRGSCRFDRDQRELIKFHIIRSELERNWSGKRNGNSDRNFLFFDRKCWRLDRHFTFPMSVPRTDGFSYFSLPDFLVTDPYVTENFEFAISELVPTDGKGQFNYISFLGLVQTDNLEIFGRILL